MALRAPARSTKMAHAIALLREWERLSVTNSPIERFGQIDRDEVRADGQSWLIVEVERIKKLWDALPRDVQQAAQVAVRLLQ